MKKIFLILVAVLSLNFVTLGVYQPALAQFKDEACEGIKGVNPDAKCDASANTPISKLLKNVLNIFSLVVGVIAVIMLIIGGIKYITSQGEAGALASARNTIIYAVVGLVIVAIAQVIVRFVLQRATA